MAEYSFPNQRVSINKKQTEEWYINNIHYWINLALGANDKAAVSKNYNAANAIVDEETYNYILKPLVVEDGVTIDLNDKLPGEIRDIDFLTPIKEKNLGEYLSLPYNINITVTDLDVAISKNTHVANAIKPIIEQVIMSFMEQAAPQGEGGKSQQVDIKELEKSIKKAKSKWVNEKAISAEHLIHAANYSNRFDEIRATAFYDWWATEEVYFHNYMINDKYFFETLSPLEGYPIVNSSEYVDDYDGFLIKRKMSLFEVRTKYVKDLSKKDLEYLEKLYEQTGSSVVSISAEVIRDIYGNKRFTLGDGTRRDYVGEYNINSTIQEQILYFKTEVKLRYVSRMTPIGTTTEELVEDDYELNPEVGDIEIQNIWISQTWQQILLGDEYTGIYIKPKAIDVQIYDASGHCKIPVTGKKNLLPNIDNNPIPKRILPNLALYRIMTLQLERTIAKYKGSIELIPKSMLVGKTPAETQGKMFYRMADNTIIYDDAIVPPTSAIQGYRIVGNDSLSTYIRTLIDLRITIKDEAWDMANMNDSRYGNAPASATVTNNQQNIFRAKLGSVLMVYIFNKVLERQHTMSAEFMKVSNPNGLIGSYFKSSGIPVSFNIDPANLSYDQLGVFVNNGISEEEKLRQFKDLAVAGQIGDPALAAQAITSDNAQEIDKYIKEYNEAQQELEQQQAARAEQLERDKMAHEDKQHKQEIEKITVKEDAITKREITLKQMELSTNQNIDK